MLEINLVHGFCPPKIQITQFPNGCYLNRLPIISLTLFSVSKTVSTITIEYKEKSTIFLN